jgi:uncharacterized coiled-coil protein SlyX
MKPQNLSLIPILTISLGLLPEMQAVNPPPDGGYPNFNTAEGQNALFSLTTGAANTAVGWFSLKSNADTGFNTGVGAGTLLLNIADENTAVGAAALVSNTEGNLNTAIGSSALVNNVDGNSNTASGAQALQDNATGGGNTAVGRSALQVNTTGDTNTAIGINALQGNTSGSGNIALGGGAGAFLTTGDDNIDIGHFGVADESSTIRIGMDQSRTFIAGISGTAVTGTAVVVDGNDQLGVAPSSKRFKEEITPMKQQSEVIFTLKPVSFHYKKEIDPTSTAQFGLVAEDVEKINPDLVVHDKEGKPYSVRYDQVNAMLLNEFLKEHRKVQEQEAAITQLKSTITNQQSAIARQRKDVDATITELKEEMETVFARFKEQDAKIQSVSDQVELSGLAPRTVSIGQ